MTRRASYAICLVAHAPLDPLHLLLIYMRRLLLMVKMLMGDDYWSYRYLEITLPLPPPAPTPEAKPGDCRQQQHESCVSCSSHPPTH